MRFGLVIAYDGTHFHGSQIQACVRTIQGEIEETLANIYGQSVRVRLASRTDMGVHAECQVGRADINTEHGPETVMQALNHNMADDLRITSADSVSACFDPRRDALAREYVYTITDAEVPAPLNRDFEAPVRGPLDHETMGRVGTLFEGTHDFMSFAGPATSVDSSAIRRVDKLRVTRQRDRVTISVRANAFVHQQMRRLVAVLVDVGRGLASKDTIVTLLDSPRKGAANKLMPARGLCLTRIFYARAAGTFFPAAWRGSLCP